MLGISDNSNGTKAKFLVLVSVLALASTLKAQERPTTIEGYPPDVLAALEIRDRARRNAPREVAGFAPQYVFTVANKWTGAAGEPPKVTVAFKDGDSALRQQIAEAAGEWSSYGRVTFDFTDPQTGTFREWSPSDTKYRADIRISFDQSGYWSVVGIDSIDGVVRRPGQPSMNFGQFTESLPNDWRTVVKHEFGHALGLQHEHQAPVGGCDGDWKWDDDPGYVPTEDAHGWYGADSKGRKPGIYTLLGGYPNYWPKAEVDRNLRQLNNDDHAYDQGPFDKDSIMKYFFPAAMFAQKEESHCYSQENQTISLEDQKGIAKWYPAPGPALSKMQETQRSVLLGLIQLKEIDPSAKQSLQLHLDKLTVQPAKP